MDKEKVKGVIGLVVVALIIQVCASLVDYHITNDFLARLGFDRLSFFQVTILGCFTRLMVGAQTFVEPITMAMQKDYKDKLSIEDQVVLGLKRGFMSLCFNGVAYLVYIKLVIPKFLS
jgi:hypothetical protein